MRLDQDQIATIRRSARELYGNNAHVWLFGSRVDDNRRGGDIDLYVEPEIQNPAMLVEAKLRFLMELHRQFGEQKIDVVIHRAGCKEDLPIYRIARETGVQLL
jgi:predicted nucleotidyltransferase